MKYLFGTGIVGAVTSGLSLMRAQRQGAPMTWRLVLTWVSWLIALALAIGTILDIRTASRGGTVEPDSPIAGKEQKYYRRAIRRSR